MKKYKQFKLLGLSLVFSFLCISCTQEDVDDKLVIDHTGGLINVLSNNVNYVVGNPGPYSIDLLALHGNNSINSIDVYNTFVNNLGESSNTTLLKTINLEQSNTKEPVNFSVNFTDLISDITFDGAALSNSDTELSIGDGFVLSYVANLKSGDSSSLSPTTKLTVSTRFAGKYRVITGNYWRIGVPRPDVAWEGEIVDIESVDAITYKHVGLSIWTDQAYWFTIDGTRLTVLPTNPSGEPVILNDQPITTCELNENELSNVPCQTSNYVEIDNLTGKDKLFITVGYLASTGPREFYEVLEKIID